MTINPFIESDFNTEAKEFYTEQFKNKPILDAFVKSMLSEAYVLQSVYKDLMQLRSIDTASGVMLDIIGNIVGQPRELVGAAVIEYFGFEGATGAKGFSDQPANSGFFYDFGDPVSGNILVDDPLYRLLIKARIAKNSGAGTPEEVLSAVKFIFNIEQATVVEGLTEGQAAIFIYISRPLSPLEKYLIIGTTTKGFRETLIPKPAGVLLQFVEYETDDYFAFQGVPGAQGFGELSQVNWGSNWGNDWGGTQEQVLSDGGFFANLLS